MSISFKNKLLIILFSAIGILLFFRTNTFAAIEGCISSNQPPQLIFEISETKLDNVIVNIKDPNGIKEYTVEWRNSSGKFVTCPTKLYSKTTVSSEHIKIKFLDSGMAGGENEFKIYAKDKNDVAASRTFTIKGKKTYYALDCFPRVSNLKFVENGNKLTFTVTDNGKLTNILVKDLYNEKKQITSVDSTSVEKNVSFSTTNLKISKTGYFYIQIYAKDKNGMINNMYFKFKCKPTGKIVAKLAKNFKGCSYVYGAEGPNSFDCSGLTRYVYKQFNINLPHQSGSQRKYGTGYTASTTKAGDVLCFDGHVGIYVGSGRMVHAANSNTGVVETDFKSGSYYYSRLITARRLLKYE